MDRRTCLLCSLLITLALLPVLVSSPVCAAAASQLPGFPAALNANIDRQSPVIAEIHPDSPGLEIAIADSKGDLFVVSKGGQLLWSKQVLPDTPACGIAVRLQNAPAVGDLDGDGASDVVIGFGTLGASPSDGCPGGVAAFDGRSGALKWRYTIVPTGREPLSGVFSIPALADVDGDGKMEVAFGSFDRHFYLLSFDGKLTWRFHTADTVWSSPTFADVDGDGRQDVVFGADIAAGGFPGLINGGFVYAFKTLPLASSNKTISFSTDPAKLKLSGLIWRAPGTLPNYDQVIYSSPAIGDLDNNGSLEVVFASGCYYPRVNGQRNGRWVKVLDAATGNELRTMTTPYCSRSSPALGDLDGDDKLDIAINVTGRTQDGGDNQCHTLAWKGDGTPLWSSVPVANYSASDCDNIQAPVIADVDGNGSLEVLTGAGAGLAILNGRTGVQLSDSNGLETAPHHGTPAIGDLNGDGVLEVALGAGNQLFAWTSLSSAINSPPNSAKPSYAAPWPMFRGNPQRSGIQPKAPSLQLLSSSLGLVLKTGSATASMPLRFGSSDGSAVSWTAAADQNWISLDRDSGTSKDILIITLNPAAVGNKPGTYQGTLTITAPSAAITPAAALAIPVRLVIADTIYTIHLPIVQRR